MFTHFRLSSFIVLCFCVATPSLVSANRGRAKAAATKQSSKQKALRSLSGKAKGKRAPTGLRPNVVRVGDKASITKADSAVISHLALPLQQRGVKEMRLNKRDAESKIKETWKITDTRIVANANPQTHPITGNATVLVDVQAASKNVIGKKMNLKTKIQFVVNIGTNGKAAVIGQRGNSKPAKLLRAMNEKLAVGQMVKDIVRSRGVKQAGTGVGVLVLALLATQTSAGELSTQLAEQLKLFGPAVLTASVISAKNGLGRRTTARLHAFEQVTRAFGRELASGKSITIDAAYGRYAKALEVVTIGNQVSKNVKPISRENFVTALAAWESAQGFSKN